MMIIIFPSNRFFCLAFLCVGGNFTGYGGAFGQMVSAPLVFVLVVDLDCDKIEGRKGSM
jgi:hypothetical protein